MSEALKAAGVYLGNAVWRDVDAGHASDMRRLIHELTVRGIPFEDGTKVGDALIDRSRSVIASNFLRSPQRSGVLLIIDADIRFRVDDALRICEEALEHDMVGGLYVTRALRTQPTAILPTDVTLSPEGGLVEVPYLSTGFVAIHRRVYEALVPTMELCHQSEPEPFWPFHLPMIVPDEIDGFIELSEDWALTRRARDLGFHAWIDTAVRLEHMATLAMRIEDLMRPPTPPEQPVRIHSEGHRVSITPVAPTFQPAGEFTIPIPPAHTTPAPHVPEPPYDLRTVVLAELRRDVQRFTGNSAVVVDGLIDANTGAPMLAELWRHRPVGEDAEAFYSRLDVGRAYLFDLAAWHLRGGGAPARYLELLRGRDVLDFGAGIGTFGLSLGEPIDMVEINPTLREFIEFRIKRHGLAPSRVLKYIPPIDRARYDVAVAWDVLEHVADPAVTVVQLHSRLRPGGLLIVHAPFGPTIEHPQHLPYPGGREFWDTYFSSFFAPDPSGDEHLWRRM